jgi:hypothetical protein
LRFSNCHKHLPLLPLHHAFAAFAETI